MKVQDIVTQKIIDSLENGVVPWHKPWKTANPQNAYSKKEYRGINYFLLSLFDYETPYFVSFKQCEAMGGQVKKGEKSSMVVFWTILDKAKLGKKNKKDQGTDDVQEGKIPFLRYYNVFNVSQTTIPAEKLPKLNQIEKFCDHEEIEAWVKSLSEAGKIPVMTTNASSAHFNFSKDEISLPKREQFDSEANYYSTLFHEIIHSTGHKSRLDRLTKEKYAQEELCAELGAAILCAHFGVNATYDNSVSYIGNWLKELNNDRNLIIKAASYAQKAIDFLMNEEEKEEKGE